MMKQITRAAVVGAGTMGAAISAQLANAGARVLLLDIVPPEVTPKDRQRGLTKKDRQMRDRLARNGLDAARESRPASFYTADHARLVETGNLEDDFGRLGEADWIIEAVVENLEVKRELMQRLDQVRKPTAVVTTNTSGIQVFHIAEGTSESFRAHFLGAHFFNPPRYVRLLELIPTRDTLPEAVKAIEAYARLRLGKGIVHCKDTPNFIANRIGSVTGAFALDFILRNGYTVEEVDAITGPLIGRPKTAIFRLLDLVGLDVVAMVRKNLALAVPEDAFAQEYLNAPEADRLTEEMISRGWLGQKAGQGFYKEIRENGKKAFWPLDLQTLEYRPQEKVSFDSVRSAGDLESLRDRLEVMLRAEDRAGDLVRALVLSSLAYASRCIPEIAETPAPIDDAMRWGFMHAAGPFEIWDQLGVRETRAMMAGEGFEPAPWVNEMASQQIDCFYSRQDGETAGVYHHAERGVVPLPGPGRHLSLQRHRLKGSVIEENAGASLIDLGDGVGCVEFHTKMNALDEDIGRMLEIAWRRLDSDFLGLVIGNEAENFSAGANLMLIVLHAQAGQWDELSAIVRGLQDIHMAFRYSPKPVVVAPYGLTLGGGAEMMMHASRLVASAELYTGLVETGMGLVPAGGGTKELMRRIINPAMRTKDTNVLPFLQQVFEQIGQAKVATSAAEARLLGMLTSADRIVVNPDALLFEARREVLHMLESGYAPPLPEKIFAAGRDGQAALRIGLFTLREGAYITEHEVRIGEALIRVLSGGDISQPGWVDERFILELEAEAFLSLCGEAKTQERIWHFLQTGKPLRN